jgi:hypothetical protein
MTEYVEIKQRIIRHKTEHCGVLVEKGVPVVYRTQAVRVDYCWTPTGDSER